MLCEYGCNQEANFQLKNGKNCCSKSSNSCPINRNKNKQAKLNNPSSYRSNLKDIHLDKRICRHCNQSFSMTTFKKHEVSCYMNPINIKVCPICNNNIKIKSYSACSRRCAKLLKPTRYFKPDSEVKYNILCWRYHKKECIICGENNIVETHHYDKNHNNNSIDNFVPLCPTHHKYCHHNKYKKLVQDKIDQYVINFKNRNT